MIPEPLSRLSATALSPAVMGTPGGQQSAIELSRSGTPVSRVRFGNVPRGSAIELRFLQDRLALYAWVSLWLSDLLGSGRL